MLKTRLLLASVSFTLLFLTASDLHAQFSSGSVLTQSPGQVFIFPNNEDKQPYALATADIDHDKYPDIMTADIATDTLTAILTIPFGGSIAFIVAGTNTLQVRDQPKSVALASLEVINNKKIDVLSTASGSSFVDYSFGFGTGAFPPHNAVFYGPNPLAVDVCDWDCDGNPNMIFTVDNPSTGADTLAIRFGNGNATGAPPNFPGTTKIYGSGSGPCALDVGDIDLDGPCDAAVANLNDSNVYIYNNECGPPPIVSVYPVAPNPRSVVLGDLDCDKRLDFATASLVPPNVLGVTVYLSSNNYTFPSFLSLTSAGGEQPVSVAIGDVTGDGDADLVVATGHPPTSVLPDGPLVVDVYSYSCTGQFFSLVNSTTVPGALGPRQILLADFDIDGKLDAAVANQVSNNVSYLLNTTPTPAGVVTIGGGTHGCFGCIAMCANSAPSIGNTNFRFTCTNAPHHTIGIVIVASLCGSFADIFGLGIDICVDLVSSTEIFAFDICTNVAGDGATAGLVIPNSEALINVKFCAQSIFFEDRANGYACSDSFLDLVSSKCIEITIQQ